MRRNRKVEAKFWRQEQRLGREEQAIRLLWELWWFSDKPNHVTSVDRVLAHYLRREGWAREEVYPGVLEVTESGKQKLKELGLAHGNPPWL